MTGDVKLLMTVQFLRVTLATIWSEIEAHRDTPSDNILEICQGVAEETLDVTRHYTTGRRLFDETRLEDWDHAMNRYRTLTEERNSGCSNEEGARGEEDPTPDQPR